MGNCGCSHCDCGADEEELTPEDKVKELEKEIADLGYKVEETPEGDIKISE